MARTIIDKEAHDVPEYVWLDKTRMLEVTISSGNYNWTIDLDKGECSLNSFPLNIDTRRAHEIINALQEIMPLLKPNPDAK